ncbi:MAG: 23S rRNA (guanosine(2251)-2'-O)-methyltransferase RlmB [Betaproteobacteria bacterium]|nr:MAG: 23S rRNA (guanosine(2251)-2'-O)-methyltransferase RlmB [Betaproteobacteria bacterium]
MKKPRIVFGFHAVLARLRADPSSVLEIFLDETRNDARGKDLAGAAERTGVRLMRVPTKRLDGFYGGGRHQGVVARVAVKSLGESLDDVLDAVEQPLLLVLDGVTDPHNLGACLRVANAAGAHAVIAPKDRAAGITPAVSKVASGAAEATPYLMVTNLARTLRELKERHVWIVGAEERAPQSLYDAQLPDAIAWVLGAEGEGMRRLTRENCDLLVSIPMGGEVESLNVSVSAGVCLFESVRRRTSAQRAGQTRMAKTGPAYTPPDPTLIELKPEALDYWARTLETKPDKIRKAVQKVGPVLETVKKELGIAGV